MIYKEGYIAVGSDDTVFFFFEEPARGTLYDVWKTPGIEDFLILDREDLPDDLQEMSWEDEPVRVKMICENIVIQEIDEIRN